MKQNTQLVEDKVKVQGVDFISLVAHQLRAPLVSLRWFLDMLQKGTAGPLNKEQEYLASNASQILEHLAKLEEVLLRLGRLDAGRVVIQPKPLDLLATTKGLVDSLRPFIEEKSLSVAVSSVPEQLPMVPADQEFLWQLLQILVTNAINYSSAQGRINISIAYQDNDIVFAVKDQGIGIPQQDQQHVFEMFYRAGNAVKFTNQGSGLGLSLAKSLVESWGGKIWFESQENQGTTFFFSLPKEGMSPKTGEVTLSA